MKSTTRVIVRITRVTSHRIVVYRSGFKRRMVGRKRRVPGDYRKCNARSDPAGAFDVFNGRECDLDMWGQSSVCTAIDCQQPHRRHCHRQTIPRIVRIARLIVVHRVAAPIRGRVVGRVVDDTPNCSGCMSHCSSPCSCTNSWYV